MFNREEKKKILNYLDSIDRKLGVVISHQKSHRLQDIKDKQINDEVQADILSTILSIYIMLSLNDRKEEDKNNEIK